jgi:hypothetical protein
MGRLIAQDYPPLNEKGFTVFAVRHGSSPRHPMSAIVADMRRAVRFIRQRASTASTPTALACMAAAPAVQTVATAGGFVSAICAMPPFWRTATGPRIQSMED